MLRNTLIVATATIPVRITHPLRALVCALAMTLLVAGNVAASQLPTDQGGAGAAVDPRLDMSIRNLHLRFKLATTAGYDILVRG